MKYISPTPSLLDLYLLNLHLTCSSSPRQRRKCTQTSADLWSSGINLSCLGDPKMCVKWKPLRTFHTRWLFRVVGVTWRGCGTLFPNPALFPTPPPQTPHHHCPPADPWAAGDRQQNASDQRSSDGEKDFFFFFLQSEAGLCMAPPLPLSHTQLAVLQVIPGEATAC